MQQPLKQKKLSDIILVQLENMILEGGLLPGEKLLPERELAKKFDVLYISNVPKMGVNATGKVIVHGIEDSYQREKQTLDEHTLDDEARRFIALVDEFYDCHKLLVINAEADIKTLYTGKKLSFEYARTQSRIVEMQNW